MANETIYGCVEADRKITFTQGVCKYQYPDVCIIRDGGIHDQQVAVTLDNGCCDDIYYGCINWTTKKFQVSVPDNCCDCETCCPKTKLYAKWHCVDPGEGLCPPVIGDPCTAGPDIFFDLDPTGDCIYEGEKTAQFICGVPDPSEGTLYMVAYLRWDQNTETRTGYKFGSGSWIYDSSEPACQTSWDEASGALFWKSTPW